MSPAEFAEKMRHNEMRLALVGMSNAGKTTLSKALASAFSFTHVEIDRDIEAVTQTSDIGALAEWMGLPGSEGYATREQRFLALEEEFTTRERNSNGNLVLDTTGSVIHISEAAKQTILDSHLVVHLDVGEKALDVLIERFFRQPKPLVWAGHYNRRANESEHDALVRCYPDLLQARLHLYRKLAHVNVPTAEAKHFFGLE